MPRLTAVLNVKENVNNAGEPTGVSFWWTDGTGESLVDSWTGSGKYAGGFRPGLMFGSAKYDETVRDMLAGAAHYGYATRTKLHESDYVDFEKRRQERHRLKRVEEQKAAVAGERALFQIKGTLHRLRSAEPDNLIQDATSEAIEAIDNLRNPSHTAWAGNRLYFERLQVIEHKLMSIHTFLASGYRSQAALDAMRVIEANLPPIRHYIKLRPTVAIPRNRLAKWSMLSMVAVLIGYSLWS
jgi:hypothetical protein